MRISTVRFSVAAIFVAGLLGASPLQLNAQTTGNPNNPFPGTGTPFELTWGSDDGAACTQVGASIDNGNVAGTDGQIKVETCLAAKFDYYSNGWAQLSIWNRAGAEGSFSAATLRGFGLFWCEGAAGFACNKGENLLVGGTPPTPYDDGTSAGNWYPGGGNVPGQTNDPVDWRLIDPAGNVLISPTTYPITDVTNNFGVNTLGDGFYDAGAAITAANTPFTSLNGSGAYTWQFYLGTGSDYDFTNQWLVLDANFQNVTPTGKDPAQADFSCVDDRYQGTVTAGTKDDDAAKNVGCGGVGVGGLLDVGVVPEPASMVLLATGLIGLAPLARRRRRVK